MTDLSALIAQSPWRTNAVSQITEAPTAKLTIKPLRVAILPITAWATDYEGRAIQPVEIGLKILSESDIQSARSEAVRAAWNCIPGEPGDTKTEERIEAFNDALIRFAVARGTCKPTDATLPYWDMAEDVVSLALTTDGIKFLWEELQKLKIERSPLSAEIDDDEASSLAAWLTSEKRRGLPKELLRLLHECHDRAAAALSP